MNRLQRVRGYLQKNNGAMMGIGGFLGILLALAFVGVLMLTPYSGRLTTRLIIGLWLVGEFIGTMAVIWWVGREANES